MKQSIPNTSFYFKKSIVAAIHSLSIPIIKISNSIIPNLIFFENMADVSPQYITYLKSISYEQELFNKISKKISAFAYSHFRFVTETLSETLIPINIDVNQPITSVEIKPFHFFNQLASFEENSFSKRSFLYFLTNLLTIELLTDIIQNVNKDEILEIKSIFCLFFDRILKDIQHSNNSLLMLPLASKWENFFNIISELSPEETYACMLQSISQNVFSESQMKFIFISFCSISIKNVSNSTLNSKSSISVFSSIFEYIKNKNRCLFYDSVTFFLSSILRQVLISQNGELSYFSKLLSIAKSEQNIPLLTIFSIYSPAVRQTVNFRTISKMASEIIKISPSHVLYSFTHFLKTPNVDLKSQEMSKMLSIVQTYINSYGECSDYLTEFIVNFAFTNFPLFVKDYLPALCQKDFIESNSISLFESMKLILRNENIVNQFPKEVKNIKKEMVEISYLYLLDVKENPSLVVFDVKPISDPFDILVGSEPIEANLPSPKNFENDISIWKQHLLNNSDSKQLFEKIPTKPLQTQSVTSRSNSPLIHCVALVPLLGYSDKLTMALMPLIFHESIHLASVAFRAIEAIVLLDKKRSSQVLARLLSLKKCEINEHLYIMIKCALMIERIVAPNFDECLYPLIILGLCSTSYEVRNITFSLIKCSSQLSELFSKNAKMIFDKSIHKIAITLSCDSIDENLLPYRSFEDIANSDYQIIYHFFLSCLFSIINHPLIDESRSFIFNHQPLNPSALFTLNLSTFLVATATNDFPSQKDFNEIVSKVTTAVLEGGEKRLLLLLSFASSVSISRSEEILLMLKGPNELYLHAFSLCAYVNWIRSPNEDMMNKLFAHCGHIVNFCDALGYFSMTNVVTISEDLLLRRNSLMLNCLCDFSRLISLLCDFYRDSHCQPANGPYLHRSFVTFENRLKYDTYFIFLLNLTFCQNKRLRRFARNAFASYCAISLPSNEVASILIKKMPQIVEDCNNIASATNILANSIDDKLLDYFITKAKSDFRYFICIANLFEDVKSLNNAITKIKKAASLVTPETISNDDKRFAITIFNSTGRLLALALFYLAGDKPGNGNESSKLLIHLIISTSIIYNLNKKNNFVDLNSLSLLFDFCEQNMFDNSLLSFQKINNLNDLLSDSFSFFSESFIMESFKIGQYPFFSCFLKKWISNIEPQNNNYNIQPHLFSHYSFIKLFLETICKKPLQPPIIDILYQFKSINEFIIIAFNLSKTYHDECLSFLSALLTIYPKKVENLCCLFESKFWLYSIIKKIKIQGQQKDEFHFNYSREMSDYFSLTNFAKHLARKIIKISNSTRDKLKPLLYSFSFIFDDKINKHKLNSYQKEVFWKNCFEFGLSCGDFNVANRAIQYALNKLTESKIEYIEKVQNTLALMTDILINNDNLALLDSLDSLCFYTSQLIVFLAKLNVNLKTPQISIFQTIISFIQFTENDAYQPILSAVFESIMIHISLENAKDILKPQQPSFFLINEIAFNGFKFENKNKKEEKLIDEIFYTFTCIFSLDLSLYLSEKPELSFLALFPYFKLNLSLFELISKKFEVDESSQINDIVIKFNSALNENEISILLRFYLATISFLTEDILANIYEICSYLMLNGRKNDLFNDFASFLLKEIDTVECDSFFFFLTTYQKNQLLKNEETIIFNSNSTSRINRKIQIDIQATAEFETLFFVPIDEILLRTPCKQISSYLKISEEFIHEPFSAWEEIFNNLKKQETYSNKVIVNDISWKCDFDCLSKPGSSRNKSRRNSRRSLISSFHENENFADTTNIETNSALFQVNLNIFTPTPEEIDDIGAELVNFPSFC